MKLIILEPSVGQKCVALTSIFSSNAAHYSVRRSMAQPQAHFYSAFSLNKTRFCRRRKIPPGERLDGLDVVSPTNKTIRSDYAAIRDPPTAPATPRPTMLRKTRSLFVKMRGYIQWYIRARGERNEKMNCRSSTTVELTTRC